MRIFLLFLNKVTSNPYLSDLSNDLSLRHVPSCWAGKFLYQSLIVSTICHQTVRFLCVNDPSFVRNESLISDIFDTSSQLMLCWNCSKALWHQSELTVQWWRLHRCAGCFDYSFFILLKPVTCTLFIGHINLHLAKGAKRKFKSM